MTTDGRRRLQKPACAEPACRKDRSRDHAHARFSRRCRVRRGKCHNTTTRDYDILELRLSLSLFLTLLWALCFREKLVCLVRFVAIHPQYLKYQTSEHRTNLLVTVCHSIKLQYILLTFPVPSAIDRRWLINEWSLGNASNLIPSKAPQQHNYQKRPHRLSRLMERNEPKPRRSPYISHNSIPILSSKFVENS